MRKTLLFAAGLAGLVAGPALASMPSEAALVQHSIGQPVYDFDGFPIGTIVGYGMSGGTPAALVRPNGERQTVAISFEDIGPGYNGGWRTVLPARNVYALWPWYPGTMDPAG